ncbi:hypothetical protein HG531_009493 [Fusarium graminearum]|nr:hypothetical protein HG531_009493 [Fusarium graminearum]
MGFNHRAGQRVGAYCTAETKFDGCSSKEGLKTHGSIGALLQYVSDIVRDLRNERLTVIHGWICPTHGIAIDDRNVEMNSRGKSTHTISTTTGLVSIHLQRIQTLEVLVVCWSAAAGSENTASGGDHFEINFREIPYTVLNISSVGQVLQRHLVDLDDLDIILRSTLGDGEINCFGARCVDNDLFRPSFGDFHNVNLARNLCDCCADCVGCALVDRHDALVHAGESLCDEQGASADEKGMNGR